MLEHFKTFLNFMAMLFQANLKFIYKHYQLVQNCYSLFWFQNKYHACFKCCSCFIKQSQKSI